MPSLLHPSEYGRLLLALTATIIVFGVAALAAYAIYGAAAVALTAGLLFFVGAFVWAVLQVFRAALLGNGVKVTEDSLPVLNSVIGEVRSMLDFNRPVDVYVVEKASSPASLTSYLGTHIILLEGKHIADLQTDRNRPQLVFLLGQLFGALKARHERFTPVIVALSALENLGVLNIFLYPYHRATTYSGDQIAASCCRDVSVAAIVMNRLLVGTDLSPDLNVRGVLDQAALVRSQILPRLVQLFRSTPHLTNRYLNLLAFLSQRLPAETEAFLRTLDEDVRRRLAAALQGSPHHRSGQPARKTAQTVIASATAAVILGLAAAALLGLPGGGSAAGPNLPPGKPAGPADELAAHVPESFRGSCRIHQETDPVLVDGLVAAVRCAPGAGGPQTVTYYQFDSTSAMETAYGSITAGLQPGDCSSSLGIVDYGSESLACFITADNSTGLLWTAHELNIMSYAQDPAMPLPELRDWWSTGSGPG
ncbi:hypothetical protein [Arthrobacter sp. GCM10027362]|uniref:hypothetical protein n=1 Tax=Arthrobacter sp. GCM10027362 TaxID=3273379 RepID=UPI003671FF09